MDEKHEPTGTYLRRVPEKTFGVLACYLIGFIKHLKNTGEIQFAVAGLLMFDI
jgi:hypothetical protein